MMQEHIYFSIDGPSQEILTKNQVGGDFIAAVQNLKKVADRRNEKGQ